MADELESTLNQLAAEAAVDFSGSFSLDPRKALEKFARFQLSGTQWCLKLVQAAVAASARFLEFQVRGRDGSWVFGEVPWSVVEIEEALWNPKLIPRESVSHLRIALWSYGFGLANPFRLDGPGWGYGLEWDGQEMRHAPSVHPSQVTLRMPRLQAKAFQPGLARRARVCPIPLVVEGRALNRIESDALLSFSPDPNVFCQLLQARSAPSVDRLFWVKDGVMVGVSQLAGPSVPGLRSCFYLSGEEVTTDLTGLAVSLPDDNEVKAVNRHLAGLVGLLQERLSERENTSGGPVGLNRWEYLLVFGAVLTLSVPLFGLPVIAVSIIGRRSARSPRWLKQRLQKEIVDYLKEAQQNPWRIQHTNSFCEDVRNVHDP